MSRCIIDRNGSTMSAHKPARAAPFLWGIANSPWTGANTRRDRPVQCRERMGGLLRYYHKEAA